MTYEQALKRATNKVLKSNDVVMVLDCDWNTKQWKTSNSYNTRPTNIMVNTIVVHKSNSNCYYVQEKLTFDNGRFKDTIIYVE